MNSLFRIRTYETILWNALVMFFVLSRTSSSGLPKLVKNKLAHRVNWNFRMPPFLCGNKFTCAKVSGLYFTLRC